MPTGAAQRLGAAGADLQPQGSKWCYQRRSENDLDPGDEVGLDGDLELDDDLGLDDDLE